MKKIFNKFLKKSFANKVALVSLIVGIIGVYFAWVSTNQSAVSSVHNEIQGKNNATVTNVTGNVNIEFTKEESEFVSPPEKSLKKAPVEILNFLQLDSPIQRVNEMLGSAKEYSEYSAPLFPFDDIGPSTSPKTHNWIYELNNLYVGVEADNGKSINTVTIQLNYLTDDLFNIPPFEYTSIDNILLGEATFSDIKQNCIFEKFTYYSSMRDGALAVECYYGNLGNYNYYTFGCYLCFLGVDATVKNEKLIDREGKEIRYLNEKIDFVSISKDENRGHPIYYQSLR